MGADGRRALQLSVPAPARERAARAPPELKTRARATDALDVARLPFPVPRPSAALVAAVAAFDVLYRILLRAPLRRSLGIDVPAVDRSRARRRPPARVPPRPRNVDRGY
jgi:hypothetical protein